MAQLHDKILIFAHVRCASTDTAGTTGNWERRWEAETYVGLDSTPQGMPLTSRLTVPTTSWAGTCLGERPSGGRPGFGFSPAALRWCLETCQRVSMGEQPRSARAGRLPLSLTMHHA